MIIKDQSSSFQKFHTMDFGRIFKLPHESNDLFMKIQIQGSHGYITSAVNLVTGVVISNEIIGDVICVGVHSFWKRLSNEY